MDDCSARRLSTKAREPRPPKAVELPGLGLRSPGKERAAGLEPTSQITKEIGLAAERFEAQVREADARLKVLTAEAEARKAKSDMDEISGLTATKERVKARIADMKQRASADYAATKQDVERGISELQTGIKRFDERYSAWNAARERRFYAQLDEAEARLKVWKAKADQKGVELTVKSHDDLATLQERIALARARAAEARIAKHSAQAESALIDAARNLDEAYAAAARRYE